MGGFEKLFYLAVLIALVETSRSDDNNTSTEQRQARANGYMIKVYSGTKMDPVMCPKEGFLADPVDCSIFYRCVKSFNGKYTVHKFKCGPGTVYDPETEICNHAGNTKRTECGGEQISIDKNSENEIEGSQELPTPITTKLPIGFHSTRDETNRDKYPTTVSEIVTTVSYPTSSTIKNFVAQESTYASLIPTTKDPARKITSLSTNLWTTLSPKITTSKEISLLLNLQKGEECIKDGFMGDSENCRKFYRCVSNNHRGFIRYEFLCSEVTIWDEDLQSCNHPWAVRRRRCGKVDDTHYSNESNDILNNNVVNHPEFIYGNKIPEPEKEIRDEIVDRNKPQISKDDNYMLRPDILDNSYFSSQVTSSPFIEKTTTVLTSKKPQSEITDGYFNQFTQPPLFTHSDVHTTSNLFNKGETGHNIQSLVGSGCSENGFIGDFNDCRKFYRCVGNGRGRFIKYEFTCSQGTVWDSNLDACNYEWAVKDCGRKKQSISDKKNINKTTAPTVSNLQPMTVTTELEFAYGNQYNNHEKRTTTTTLVPIEENALLNDCSSTGFFGNINDCQTFFRCIDNGKGKFIKYTYKCDEGTFWDPSTQSCNYIDKATSCKNNLGSNKTTLSDKKTEKITTISFALSSTEKNLHSNMVEKNYSKNDSVTYLDSYKPINPHNIFTSTKTPMNKNNVCQSSGFIGDIDDCKTFYRCVDNGNGNFIQHTFSCGEGTVWDPSIEACNHAWAVPKCGGSSTTPKDTILQSTTSSYLEKEDGYFTQTNHPITNNTHSTQNHLTTLHTTTHKTIKTTRSTTKNECTESGFRGDNYDCSKFYRCVDNGSGGYTQYEFSCGDDTVWDPNIEACNHRWAVKECSSSEEVNKENVLPIITDNIIQSSSTVNIFHTTKKYHTTTSRVTSYSESFILLESPATDKCESEGFHPDLTDCSKFYRCVNNGKDGYTKYDFTCGEGTTWNQKIQACDHRTNSDCSSTNAKPDNPHTEETIHAINQQQVSEKIPEKEITDSNEQNDCTSEGFYANPNDCSKFYRCVNDGKGGFIKYDFSCGEGTIWVQENQVCDHDTGITNCSITSPTTESISSNINSTSTYFTTTSVPKTTTQKQSDENNNKECESEGYYPHERNCKKFYRCVHDGDGKYTRYDYTCGEGTAWDTNIQSCNHINEVKRCESEQTSNQNTEAIPVLQDEQTHSETNNNIETTKQPSSTTQSNNYEDTTKYSTSTTKADKNTSTTNSSESTTESSKPTMQDDCKEEGYFGSSSNCKKFYRCVSNQNGNYTKYDFTCGEGTIWDQNIVGCNHPENVVNASCKSSDSNEMTTASSSSASESSNNQESSSSSSSSQSSSTQSFTESSEGSDDRPSNNTYTCTEAGFFADPNDCKKFYRCVDWNNNGERFSIFHFVCGEGTIWDQSLLTCNHEDSVNPPRNCSSSQQQSQNTTDETSSETTTQPYTSTTTDSSTTTSQKPTTETTTTQKPTTKTSTTQASTTQKSTTQKSTTQKSTTQESTTQESTTQESTTQESTTHESTTQESTTQKSTTTTTTTEQSSTSQASTEETSSATSSSSEQTTSGTTEQSTSSTTTETTTQDQTSTTSEQTTAMTTEQGSSSTTNAPDQSTQTEKTTTQSSTESSTTDQTESTTETSSASKECPQTNEGEYLFVCPTSFRRHPKYCNLFYQCTEDDDTHESKIATFHCPNNTIYDESKVQCVEEKKADKKCEGEIAARRRVKRLGYNYKEPIIVGKEKMACQVAGYHLFEKNEECSPAFMKCESTTKGKLRGYVYKCPEGYLYWKISKRCEAIRKIKDCKRSSFDWNGRNEIPIEKLNVAP